MPKDGLPDSEWMRRLQSYANGNYVFGRGQAPPPKSKWAKKRAAIDSCPVKKAFRDVYGNKTLCSCGFHRENVSVQYY